MKRNKFDQWTKNAYGPYSAGYNTYDLNTITTSGTAATITTAGNFQIAASSPAMRNEPETPLEWLDRRVKEVCVAL